MKFLEMDFKTKLLIIIETKEIRVHSFGEDPVQDSGYKEVQI